MSYLKGLSNSVRSQGGFKKWPISDVDPLMVGRRATSVARRDQRSGVVVQVMHKESDPWKVRSLKE